MASLSTGDTLSPDESQVLQYLQGFHMGRQNPATYKDLSAVLGMSERYIQRITERLREIPHPVIGATTAPFGTFYMDKDNAEDREECARCIAGTERRAHTMLANARRMKKLLPEDEHPVVEQGHLMLEGNG